MIKRYPWENFPPVWIHANELSVKQHPAYRAARSGDPDAAYQLVITPLNSTIIGQLATQFATQKPVLVSAHAVEDFGINTIPEALADMLAQRLNWTVDTSIIQTNIVEHTYRSRWFFATWQDKPLLMVTSPQAVLTCWSMISEVKTWKHP